MTRNNPVLLRLSDNIYVISPQANTSVVNKRLDIIRKLADSYGYTHTQL